MGVRIGKLKYRYIVFWRESANWLLIKNVCVCVGGRGGKGGMFWFSCFGLFVVIKVIVCILQEFHSAQSIIRPRRYAHPDLELHSNL